MSDEISFRRFLSATREKALEIVEQIHISAEARNVLKDFVEVSRQTERLLEARTESNADQRVLQKRFEALKNENKELKEAREKSKAAVVNELAPLLKEFTTAAVLVNDRASKISDEAIKRDLQEASLGLKMSVKALIDVLSKI